MRRIKTISLIAIIVLNLFFIIFPTTPVYAQTIGDFSAPSTVYADRFFYLNVTINDPDGVNDFVNATVELSNGIILLWENSTDTFSEYQDTNGYCTLDESHKEN